MSLRSRVAVGVALAACLVGRASNAAAVRIRLLRPTNGGALVRELTARTAGELVAAGFSVELQDLKTTDSVIGAATEGAPVAAAILIDAVDEPPPDGPPVGPQDAAPSGLPNGLIEITVGGQVVYHATVGHDQIAADDGGRVLAAAAVRAVAALQTALLDRQALATSSGAGPPPPSPPPVDTRAGAGAPPGASRVGLGVAASVLQGGSGIGPTFAPVARLSYHATSLVVVGLRVLALGTRATTTAAAGSARVGQDLAMGDVLVEFRSGKRVHPILAGGVGLYHVALDGTGVPPYVGQSASLWAAAASIGAGLFVDITPRLAATFESQTLWVWPEPAVKIDTVDAGRAGRPSFCSSIGLVVSL